MIPTARHLEYARGYIDLGMVNEASDELEAIDCVTAAVEVPDIAGL